MTLGEYLFNPCGASSLPYDKALAVKIPLNMTVLHHRDFCSALLEKYIDEPYFRLIHRLEHIEDVSLPKGFVLSAVSSEQLVSQINSCYEDIGITKDSLSAFPAEMTVVVIDKSCGKIAASGLAKTYPTANEAALEWIQTSQEYRSRGLGRYVVCELLKRLRPRVEFVTVSGRCNNPHSPERLYRRCGFRGGDIWHILTEKEK
ncbi:MAG: GNAT family N-acetyltransferase [Oscillospiraceae bacterium]|nr:GNAT family N-acetyltransferase [Oscillospiraceae bacterium]